MGHGLGILTVVAGQSSMDICDQCIATMKYPPSWNTRATSQLWSSYVRVKLLLPRSLRSSSAAIFPESTFSPVVTCQAIEQSSSSARRIARFGRGISSGCSSGGLCQRVPFGQLLCRRGQLWSSSFVKLSSQGETWERSSEAKVVGGVEPGGLEHLSDEKSVSSSSGLAAPILAVSDASGSLLHRESQFSVRLPPDDVMGNVENQKSPRKIDEKVELGTGEELAGTAVENVKAGSAEKAQLKLSESGKSEEQKVAGRIENSMSAKAGSGHPRFVIYIASKSSAEAEFVEKLKSGEGLQLPDDAEIITAESPHRLAGELFDVLEYLDYLQTSQFGRLVLYSSLIPSTQTLLSQNFHSFPAGTLCVAGAQLQGKGRGGNVWQSPKGCLMFSFTTQMTDGRRVPFIQYIVSLAVIEAVEETCTASEIPVPDVRIKWPNDLYANGLKIGGVLCTSTYRAKTFNIVVGVGLNVGNREPTTCLDALVEELHGGPVAIKKEPLLAVIMSKFEILNKTFQDQGFFPLQEEYCRKWLHSGQSVVLEERRAHNSSISHVPVTIQGLTPMGYLLAADDKGEQYELHPDGNSFDFMKGLVRQKLAAE